MGRDDGKGAWREVMFGGGLFTEALSGFVLGWAGVGGVIR
jgi:ER membrane protein complex subunit 6